MATQNLATRPQLSLEAVADLAGLGSTASLRRHVRNHGLPAPGRYRQMERAGAAA